MEKKMEIPLNAQVECTDGICGRSVFVLINPVIDQVTHLVVKEDSASNTEYIVPVEFVTETMFDTIRLRCSKAEMEKMEPFIKTGFIQEEVPDYSQYPNGFYGMGTYYYRPYVIPEKKVEVVVKEQHQGNWRCGVAHVLRQRMAMLGKSMNS